LEFRFFPALFGSTGRRSAAIGCFQKKALYQQHLVASPNGFNHNTIFLAGFSLVRPGLGSARAGRKPAANVRFHRKNLPHPLPGWVARIGKILHLPKSTVRLLSAPLERDWPNCPL
jgi:hypothetical protein